MQLPPSDTEILRAARAIRSQFPQISRNELFIKLKQSNNWDAVSNKQIKKLLSEYGLDGSAEPAPPPALPANALAAQQRYKDESIRIFRLYGRGELKRELLRTPEGRTYVKTNTRGEPLWDESINGEFVVLVVKINKGDGLTEYGPV
ncbi:hypothetical protein LTR10_015126 [Elasticomyces elasticus]|uniref:Clr5 domain-containing protein n=1 Tax=Exophiala sideris TaxID=1016849 RepID=A0ABR0JQY1_9EURO|nr:hypothetical protein LTR10_015126 [Elasticomyces elasticus]KAK5034676.1 hypothetical protein LTR13_006332 [Exophiala sideris]KAK5040002.1 hypothetical protein LTS07_000497 [Exophiala sideris]KAK5068380.1 hypothetical protein LTR69_000498 [Exophiala sideris]KAK5187682.1 hypothetical protein LTR44_000498 [Eurotiomycetes sp. CCFEE 6388]